MLHLSWSDAGNFLLSLVFHEHSPPSTSLVSPWPPWLSINVFSTKFLEFLVKNLSNSVTHKQFIHLLGTAYKKFLSIFTNRSLVRDPDVSVGPGIVVGRETSNISKSWLPKYP